MKITAQQGEIDNDTYDVVERPKDGHHHQLDTSSYPFNGLLLQGCKFGVYFGYLVSNNIRCKNVVSKWYLFGFKVSIFMKKVD